MTAAAMKLEAVMENLQRHHQQRMREQQQMKSPESDDVIKSDDVAREENHSDNMNNSNDEAETRNGGNCDSNIKRIIIKLMKNNTDI